MPFRVIREFIQLETSGGVVLFLAAVLALMISNTPLAPYYKAFFDLTVTIQVGNLVLSKPLLLWINDGLMTIFFLLVGLEIKREMLEGELNSLARALFPAMAAIGGMLVPALVYLYFNYGDFVAMRGWAIPAATDTAFSLGILALLGSRVPVSLKIFLMALAIFDDIGAVAVVAIFYTKEISFVLLPIVVVLVLVLFVLNRFNVMKLSPYVLVGIVLWVCVLKSGVHAILAGIVLAFSIPLRDVNRPQLSPFRQLEHKLHPWVAFCVLPVFAFANSGISLSGINKNLIFHPIAIGIACGLFFGKQIGIWLASYLSVRCKLAPLPKGAGLLGIYGVSLTAGVGFTMSLLIGTLAFGAEAGDYPVLVRLGVIGGSLVSGLLGYFVLRFAYPNADKKSQQ